MDLGELQELIRVLEASGLSEMEIEEDGRRVRLTRQTPLGAPASLPAPASPQEAGSRQATHAANSAAEDLGVQAQENGLITIDSPMVGTFYSAPGPGKAPFVLPGDTVDTDQTLCVVEAMKVMNEVKAKIPAIIEKVLVENGDSVEFGQPLFTARPLV